MSAALLDELLAGYLSPVRIAFAAPAPAKAAKAANREHPCGLVADSPPCVGLRILANPAGTDALVDPDSQTFAGVRNAQNGPQSEQPWGLSQDSQVSQGCPSTCAAATPQDMAAVAWTEADIARFVARRDRLMRWGWHEADAEALAERLVKRDRDGDVRVTCVECKHYRPGHCGNHRAAMLSSPDVGRELATLPQRCPGFKP